MLTVNSILTNPTKGASHLAPRSLIIRSLTYEFFSIYQFNQIQLHAVKMETNNSLMVHLKLLSRSNQQVVSEATFQTRSKTSQNIAYDIVIEFMNIKRQVGNRLYDGIDPNKTEIKVFSNSPEFIFTYAYAYNKRNYLIGKFKSFLGNKALTEAPKVKNPHNEIGISTSLFYALKYLETINFYGNYNYVKFLNSLEIRPLTFTQIQNQLTHAKNFLKSSKNKHKK